MKRLARIVFGAVALGAAVFASASRAADHDNDPTAPFRIADDLYYVGASDIAAYLVVTSGGLILIDGGYESTAPQILKNLQALGYQPEQVRVLLNTHAHLDHAGGLALLKRETGAILFAMPGDAELMERGGKGDFGLGDKYAYPPVKPDRLLKDGEQILLGTTTLTAHLTPGHTKGCTTWTWTAADTRGGKRTMRPVLLLCSNSILPMYRLAGNESYPGIATDYEKSYAFWRSAPCEIFIASHGQFFGMQEKRQRIRLDFNPFVDPAGCKAWFDKGYAAFHAELDKQKAAAAPKP